MLNSGVFVLNDSGDAPVERTAFCVLGRPRGGTTMASRMLEAAGVFMGENMPVTAEDPEFAELLKDANPDPAAFNALVEKRNAAHSRWGFKAPFRHHWDLLDRLENVRFLVVFRDVLAVANRNRISANAELVTSMLANIELERKIVDYVARSTRPSLLFSYEKALIFPDEVCRAVLDFVGAEVTETRLAGMRDIVQPSEPTYVAAQDPSRFAITLTVDILTRNRVAGWARCAQGSPVTLIFEVDGKQIATQAADRPRSDLAQKFGQEGRHAFDLKLPPASQIAEGSELIIRSAADNRTLFRKRL